MNTTLIIFLAEYLLWIMFAFAFILGLRNSKFLINSVFALLIVRIVAGIIKNLYNAPRPFVTHSNLIPLVPTTDSSFPSVHASLSSSLALLIGVYFPKYRILAFFIAILIAYGRVAALVHYPLDVIAGFCIGLGITWLFLVFRKVL